MFLSQDSVTYFLVIISYLVFCVSADMQNADAASPKSNAAGDNMRQQQQSYQELSSHLASDPQAIASDESARTQFSNPLNMAKKPQYLVIDAPEVNEKLLKSDDGSILEGEGPGNWFHTSNGRTEIFLEQYPFLRNSIIITPSGDSFRLPYLSPQEFKETFRRSDPYFMGKRVGNYMSKKELSLEEDKAETAASKSVRDVSNDIDKSDQTLLPENVLIGIVSERADSSLTDGNQNLQKFAGGIGINGNTTDFMEKRRVPKFVGKRLDKNLMHRRAAPLFVGKRIIPYFAGNRLAPKYTDKKFKMYSSSGNELFFGPSETVDKDYSSLIATKRGPPMFVGKRFSDFDSRNEDEIVSGEKRAAQKFVGRQLAPYFVGKRGPPKFVGKRIVALKYYDPSLASDKPDILFDKRQGPVPYFVGKRRAPKFVGKRMFPTSRGSDTSMLISKVSGLRFDPKLQASFVGSWITDGTPFPTIDKIEDSIHISRAGDSSQNREVLGSPLQGKGLTESILAEDEGNVQMDSTADVTEQSR